MADLTKIRGAAMQGGAIPLALASKDAAPWNVLAYAVELKGRGAELTRECFEEAVENFAAYGSRVPVVLFHADTDPKAHPDSRKAHAWVTALRVGSMKRAGKTVATLEGRFEWVNEKTRDDVRSGALAFGSITFFHDAVDEESGEHVGGLLYSFSLTNNPALTDLPKLAASRDAPAPDPEPAPVGGSLSRSGAAAAKEPPPMSKLILLAATLGYVASDETAAEAHVSALATEAGAVRRALGTTTAADTAAKLSALSASAAKVPELEAKLAAYDAAEKTRSELARASHINAVVAANPALATVRGSLELHAAHDFDGFSKSYPLPKSDAKVAALEAENARVTELARGSRVTPGPGAPAAPVSTPQLPRTHSELSRERAAELRKADPKLSEREALLLASKELSQSAVTGAARQ